MPQTKPIAIKTTSELHRFHGLPEPEHPLISIVDYAAMQPTAAGPIMLDFYSVAVKRGVGKLFYGQQQYDFDEGVMYFMAPNQVLRTNPEASHLPGRSGWILFIHPDFLWNTPLAKTIRQYAYFDYDVNEALFLSKKEEWLINGILQNIKQEYHANIDKFSQNIIISQVETLLNYSERFYERQFITRKITNHQILSRLERLLNTYFMEGNAVLSGLPSVQLVAGELNVSPSYLSGVLKSLTGKSTQEHIHEKVIEKAKEKLSTTDLSVSEIAYELGFEHSQSFSKLFKSKTKQSPVEFRTAFFSPVK